jgi:hypothetical protein
VLPIVNGQDMKKSNEPGVTMPTARVLSPVHGTSPHRSAVYGRKRRA